MSNVKKPLPKVSTPTLVLTLPLSKKRIEYRPFVVREQKALLLAQESRDNDTIMATIIDVIKSCSNSTLDPTSIPTADLAYFFVQLRIASVGPEIKFSVVCEHCETTNVINMNLNDIKLTNESFVRDIKLTNDIGITFRLPTIKDVDEIVDAVDKSTALIYRLVETMYDADTVYQKDDYTEEEFADWLGDLNEDQLSQIEKFINSIPELQHPIEFDCYNCKQKNRRLVEGLHSFFRFNDGT